MTFFYNYFKKLFNLSSSEEITYDDDDNDNTYYIINKYLINSKDIQSIKLNPLTKQSKSFKYDKIDLRNLNNSQLQDILNVKLKHTVINDNRETKKYQHRHPVLQELLEKFKKK